MTPTYGPRGNRYPTESRNIQIRMTDEQHAALEEQALEAGLPLATWCRTVLLLLIERADLTDGADFDRLKRNLKERLKK